MENKNMENKNISKILAESNTEFSKMLDESYLKLYKPWIESTKEICEKIDSLSKDAPLQQYRELYDEWIKSYQKFFGENCPIPTLKPGKETLEKFLACAEESSKLYKSWISELEENSRKTKEIILSEEDPAKYKECYDMWIRSYEKMFDKLLNMHTQESTKGTSGYCMGIPNIYSEYFLQMSKLWKKSYAQLCGPFNESILKLSEKMTDISVGNTDSEAYKEFYTLLAEVYGKHFQCTEPSKEIFDRFIQNTDIYVNMYKSWIAAVEQLSESTKEFSEQKYDQERYKEFYNLWIKIYEKAFCNFFEDMPTIEGPMKDVMEPVKIMAKMYADSFANMSKMLVGQSIHSTSAYPGKNKK
jgi:hypothetical protein